MQHAANTRAAEDPRLWAIAYIAFFVKGDDPRSRRCRRELEEDARYMAKAVGVFALVLMDLVWLKAKFGVEWTTPWWEVETLKRTDPAFRAAWRRRERYVRTGLGWFVLPKRRLRRTARDVVGMLWLAYQVEAGSDAELLYGSEPVVVMLQRYQNRFGQMGSPFGNA